MAKKMTVAPILKWRDVPEEDMGEGALTGHRMARDLMALAAATKGAERERDIEEARKAIMSALKLSLLSMLGDTENSKGFVLRVWAGNALWHDMVDFLIYASWHIDYEGYFQGEAGGAIALIKRLEDMPRAPEESPGRRTRQIAKQAIDKARHG